MDGWDNLLTETKDDKTSANQDTYTLYGYGTGNAATQQTGKTVHLGDDATDPVIEDDTYTYNLQGRMASAEVEKYDSTGQTLEEHTKSEFEYDDAGIRVEEAVTVDSNNDGSLDDETATVTKYLNDSNNPTGYSQVLIERVNEAIARSYVLGLDVISQALANGTVQYLLYDGHGSTRMLVDATGQPLSGQVYAYDAFGNPIGFNPTNALTSHLYNSEPFLGSVGLYDFRDRLYDPRLGRFPTVDRFFGDLNNPWTFNKYVFCHGDGVNFSDPTGEMDFSLGGMMSSMAIGGTIGGMTNAIISAARGASFRVVAGSFLKGFALGAFMGGGVYSLTAAGLGVFSSGAVMGSLEGFISSLVQGDPWRTVAAKTVFGGLFGGLFAFAGQAALKSIGKALVPLAQKIAAAAPAPNPTQIAATATQTITNWTIRRGGYRLAKVGEYWIKEVDPDSAFAGYAETALESQLKGFQKLGNLAPEYLYSAGRLVTRDVGKYCGSVSEFFQIRILGSLRLGTIFNDIWPKNIGASGQIFDPTLTPVHEALWGILVMLGETVAGVSAYAAAGDD